MKVPKIESVTLKEGHILMITFSDGTQKAYDTTPLPERDVFAHLNNQSFFKNVSVELGGYAISWNSEIDISEYELWQHSVEIVG